MNALGETTGSSGHRRRDPRLAATKVFHRRVLLVCPRVAATFIRQDLRILQSEFDTSLFLFEGITCLRRLREEINSCDAVVIWFAGRHSGPAVWFARQIKIPITTIVGGYEAVWIPDINYGIRPHSLREWVLRWVLKNSTSVLVVSEETEQGVARVAPKVMSKTRLIYNAVDTARFLPPQRGKREGILSVGVINQSNLSRKGWSLFWKVAEQMPSTAFVAVGKAMDDEARALVTRRPFNLTWLGELSSDELVRQYQQAAAYFQGSIHEAFSLALAESMACGCIPVVSRNGALPEVAGDVGYYLDDLTVESAVKAVTQALKAPEETRVAARQRIVDHFDYERRREALCRLVRETLNQTDPGW